MTKQEFIAGLERAALAGMDTFVNKLVHGAEHPASYMVGQTEIKPESAGWKDEDLAALLPTIRAHGEALWERFDIPRCVRDRQPHYAGKALNAKRTQRAMKRATQPKRKKHLTQLDLLITRKKASEKSK